MSGAPTYNGLTAPEMLAANKVLTTGEVAFVLRLTYTKGRKKDQPNRQLVGPLVASGQLVPVDPSQPVGTRTFSVADVQRYIARPAADRTTSAA